MRDHNAYKSNDEAEQYVRHLLVRYNNAFDNHWFDESAGHGEYLEVMQATIPGQFGSNHGIDIIGLDLRHRLWLIEVSRGRRGGATRFKGGGRPVKYADGGLQMSSDWRFAAAKRFLDKTPQAPAMLQYLFGEGVTKKKAVERFKALLPQHKKAVIIPTGAHFDPIDTDVEFNREVYTCRFPSMLFKS